MITVIIGVSLAALWGAGTYRVSKNQEAATAILTINKKAIPVEIADTDAKRIRGLSGRDAMLPDHGMLFVFEKAAIHSFWMAGMRFPLDIIWIDDQKTIIAIEANAPPLENPAKPIHYLPPKPIQYALEVPAGFAQAHAIASGQRVNWSLSKPGSNSLE